jgi:hypothetical protein
MLKLDAQFFLIYNLTVQVANAWISNQIFYYQGENMVKEANGAKVKVFSKYYT